jgi:nitronate monooxygenase
MPPPRAGASPWGILVGMTTESNWLRDLVRHPVLQAPMAGGPSRPELAAAVSEAGGLGFLAAGYKTPDDVRAEIERTRALTTAAFGVNVFVPGAGPSTDPRLPRYLDDLRLLASDDGVELGDARWHDDHWDDKVALLVEDPVPVVSFAFGCPSRDIIAALRSAGTRVVITVTNADDAALAAEHGADAVCAQGLEAGAHRGGFVDEPARDHLPLDELLAVVIAATPVPVIAAGALMDGADVGRVLAAGAVAAQLGTAFLLSPESGTNETYREALTDPRFDRTDLTRAFSGRRARGLVNRFMLEHPDAPGGYPEVNDATRPMRAEAARRGDPQRMSLWAGTGWQRAEARPAGEIVTRIAEGATRH